MEPELPAPTGMEQEMSISTRMELELLYSSRMEAENVNLHENGLVSFSSTTIGETGYVYPSQRGGNRIRQK
jgi:hypothetical protein